MRVHLIDKLGKASIEAPTRSYVNIQPITIDRDTRMCIFQHPNSEIRFAEMQISPGVEMHFGYGLKQACWNKVQSSIQFQISVIDKKGRPHCLFEDTLDIRNDSKARHWHDARVRLDQFARQKIMLVFKTQVSGDNSYCWSGWSDPFIAEPEISRLNGPHKEPARHQRAELERVFRRSTKHAAKPNILIITADALRADFLGCYGHPLVKTPNIDRLARDGALFTHARAQTPTTLGSYASILTGTHALEHEVLSEWGRIRPGLPTLPQILSESGYHSLIATSEAELGEDRDGYVSLFDEEIPCLATPAQSGDITCRQFQQWLSGRPDKPFFAWLQFFDTHPPSTPPAPFNTMYYQQDPTDPLCEYNSNLVRLIHGVESCLRIESTLDQLKTGIVDTDLLSRLEATAGALSGRQEHGPDLVPLITGIGEKARNGMDEEAFCNWLTDRVSRLRRGDASDDLIGWLASILPLLREVEADIIAWLDGVVDFRYPVSQYMGEISFLDHIIGQVIDRLKEERIYDDTLILFTSPHGELLDDYGLYFHHHALMEQVLRIPAIIKLPSSQNCQQGIRIGGIFDHVDIMPTLLEAAGAELPKRNYPGRSRLHDVLSNRDIEPHDSIAVDIHGAMLSLARPPFVFLKARSTYIVSEQWQWKSGDHGLYRMQSPMSYADNIAARLPGTAREMERALEIWLALHQPIGTH